MQFHAPVPLMVLPEQAMHSVEAEVGACVPAGQARHCVLSTLGAVPAGHEVQAVLPATAT